MINRRKLNKSIELETMKSGFVKWLQQQVLDTNLDLSDDYCQFFINGSYQIRGSMIIIEMVCVPKAGVFQGIEFKPKIYVNSINCMQRPRIYNNRRIFHPNISVLSCQFISRELTVDWNPTVQFGNILRHLKYLVIEPNCHFVPNNPYNRKAAWNYHFNKTNFRNLIIQNCPLYLDGIISNQMNQELSAMDIEGTHRELEEEFWSIQRTMVKRKPILSVFESFGSGSSEDESVNLLSNQIKKLQFNKETSYLQETLPN